MSSSKKERKLEAAGCKITRGDAGTVFLSVICSLAYALYGSSYSALAASIPQLAPQLHVETSDFSVAYICRGVGYLLGTVLASYILKISDLALSKPLMTCISLILIAITLLAIAFCTIYSVVLVLFLFQGIGFGGVDMMANCAVPEMWGLRAQPWMQFMHTMFGIGSIIGPIIVGNIGFQISFVIIGFCGLTPIGLLFLGTVAGARQQQLKQKHQVVPTDEEKGDAIEMANGASTVPLYETQDFKSEDEEETNRSGPNKKSPSNVNNITSSSASTKTKPTSAKGESEKKTEESEDRNRMALTPAVKYLTCLFYFLYMGYSTGYGAWVTVYALDVDVTSSDTAAAYLTSAYWLAMTLGRLLAIFVAIHLSATTMMRQKLVECLVAGILLVCIADRSYTCLLAATLVFGYADSSIFPLGMTILTDYGFKM